MRLESGCLMSRKQKFGIFGGTFDPFHFGHCNSLQTVCEKLELDHIFVIPANMSPGRAMTAGPSAQQRLEMTQAGLVDLGEKFTVLDNEIRRGGVSYTVETLRELRLENPETDFFLIVGLDQFELFDRWRDYDVILQMANVVVTTRPGFAMPLSEGDLPHGLKKMVSEWGPAKVELNTGFSIYFLALDDIEVSATEIRRRMRSGQSVEDLVPKGVAAYLQQYGLYRGDKKKIGDYEAFAKSCAQVLNEKGAFGIIVFDLREGELPMEFSVVASGTSTRQAMGLADNLMVSLKSQYGVYPLSIEGYREGRWVVIDYGAVIVHVFYDFTRQEYKLEELWRNKAKILNWE